MTQSRRPSFIGWQDDARSEENFLSKLEATTVTIMTSQSTELEPSWTVDTVTPWRRVIADNEFP